MAKFNKECWTAADVRCPFYLSDSRAERNLSCEGYGEQAKVTNIFRTVEQKDRHMGLYCVGRFERCPMYRRIYEAKYSDD